MRRRLAVGRVVLVGALIVIILIAVVAAFYLRKPAPTPAPTTAAPGPTETQPPKPVIEEIVIGMVEPLSGTHAIFGIEAKQAAELVIEDINARGGIQSLGGAKLKLVVADSKDSIEGAKLAAEELISKHHPVVIIGAYISRHTAAMAEVTEREKVILVADALVDFLSERGWKYFFRACPKTSIHGKTAMDFVYETAKKKGIEIETVAIINEDSVFGRYTALGAYHEALTLGLTVVEHIEYPYDIADASPIVSKLIEANPDVVISVPYFSDGVLIATTMEEMGFKPMIVAGAGGCGYCDPDSIAAAGSAVEGFTQTYSYNPFLDTPYNKEIVQKFQERYGKLPTEAGGIIFYSLWTIKEALELAGQMFPEDPLNPDNLRQAFLALDITSGPAAETYPSGHIKFDESGDNIYAMAVVLQVQNGEPVLVYPFEYAQAEPIFPIPGYTP